MTDEEYKKNALYAQRLERQVNIDFLLSRERVGAEALLLRKAAELEEYNFLTLIGRLNEFERANKRVVGDWHKIREL